MSIIKTTIAIIGVALIFSGCTEQIIKNCNCPIPKENLKKISLLVTNKTEKECIADSKQLEEIIKANNLESIFESSWAIFNNDLSNTDALRILGEEKNAVLVLLKYESGNWAAITIESNSKTKNNIITPPVTTLNDKEVGPFLSAFTQYYSTNFAGALESFTSLKNSIGIEKDGEANFWVSSTLTQLGRKKEAVSILDNAISSGIITNREVKGAALLAIAQLLTPEIVYEPLTIERPKLMFTNAEELLRGINSRYWAFTQIGLGKLILLSAINRSPEYILIALSYFEQAEAVLVYPKDEFDIAHLHLMIGRAYIILAQNKKDSNAYIDKALYHFDMSKIIMYKQGEREVELEGLYHEISFANSLRR